MGEGSDSAEGQDGIRLTRTILQTLPPLGVEDEATAAIVGGMLEAAELLQEDYIGRTEP